MTCEDCELLKAQIIAYQDQIRLLNERFAHDELRIAQLSEKVDTFTAKPVHQNKYLTTLIENICSKLEWRLKRLDSRKWAIEWQLTDFETRLKKQAQAAGIKRLAKKPPKRKRSTAKAKPHMGGPASGV